MTGINLLEAELDMKLHLDSSTKVSIQYVSIVGMNVGHKKDQYPEMLEVEDERRNQDDVREKRSE